MEAVQIFSQYVETSAYVVALVFGMAGIVALAYGAIKAIILFAVHLFVRKKRYANAVRIELGHYLALGLDFLIGKDIVETIINPSFEELGLLGGIVLLRIILTIFLEREVEAAEKEIIIDEQIEDLTKQQIKAVKKTAKSFKKKPIKVS